MTRAQIIAALVAAGTVAGGALYFIDPKTGEPVSKPATFEALVVGGCDVAKVDDKTGGIVDCESGETVQLIRWRGTEIPAGYELAEPGAVKEVVDRPELTAPEVLPTVSDCVAGELRKDVSERVDGSKYWYPETRCSAQCGRARLQCKSRTTGQWLSADAGIAEGSCWVAEPGNLSGREVWPTRCAEKRPELVAAGAKAEVGEVEVERP